MQHLEKCFPPKHFRFTTGSFFMKHFTIRISIIGVMMLMGILFLPANHTIVYAQPRDSIKTIFHTYNFPTYPNLTHLCQQRVYMEGKGTKHITWDAFASEDAPSVIIEYYKKHLGNAGFSAEADGGTWRFPEDKPERVLSIMFVEADGPHRSCKRNPPTNTRSIIIISKMD
jgi:hypothetical protein